ncbi:energy transducer TonB [Gaoshiqia sp. Z1-71]|uniref:energy transducer TonB n=1 Tax=Gaoshiqia hydrogeniformans TaxID=3290090 RepID=UPI003BF91AB1
MVKTLFSILILISALNGFSQEDTSICKMGYIFDSGPLFKGGEETLRRFIQSAIIYPPTAISDSIEGIVYVSYVIDTLGTTKNHIIEKGIRNDLDAEAIRITKLIKYDSPAKLNGKPILFHFTVPVKFEIKKIEDFGKSNLSPDSFIP